ncbi:MAG: hypothetical protein WEF50_19990 [Myxococcota bacterium]
MRVRSIGLLAVALGLLLVAERAAAFPIVFDGEGGFGLSAATAAAAEADGVPIVDVDQIHTAAALGLTIPAPDVLSSELVDDPSVSNPNRATSEWSVTNSGQGGLSDAWLVFLYPTDYTPSEVGFEIDGDDGWIVVSVFAGGSYYFYPAHSLGDLAPSDTTDFLMRHLVGEPLHEDGNELVLPQYAVGAVEGIPLPEPHVLALAALGLGLAAILRRRSA